MNSNPGENRELDALVNQPKETHKGVTCLALTFGTLLSSQGTDAQRFDPLGLRLWRLVLLYAVFGVLHPGVLSATLPGPSGAKRTIHDSRGRCASRWRASAVTRGPGPRPEPAGGGEDGRDPAAGASLRGPGSPRCRPSGRGAGGSPGRRGAHRA